MPNGSRRSTAETLRPWINGTRESWFGDAHRQGLVQDKGPLGQGLLAQGQVERTMSDVYVPRFWDTAILKGTLHSKSADGNEQEATTVVSVQKRREVEDRGAVDRSRSQEVVGVTACGTTAVRAKSRVFYTRMHRNAQIFGTNSIDGFEEQQYPDARLSWEALKTSQLS